MLYLKLFRKKQSEEDAQEEIDEGPVWTAGWDVKYLMKKEAKDIMLTDALETEYLGTLTAAAHSFLCGKRSPDAKREGLTTFFEYPFLHVLLAHYCTSGIVVVSLKCAPSTCTSLFPKSCWFANAQTILILHLYYGTTTVLCSNTVSSSLQLSPVLSHCFSDPVVLPFQERYFLTAPDISFWFHWILSRSNVISQLNP